MDHNLFKAKRILFLLKERQYSQSKVSFGLINSANHVAAYLTTQGHECLVRQIIDSNSIDKEATEFKPDIVIIEALWVTRYKLLELMHLQRHKDIIWIIRIHSDIGYLAAEGHGISMINDYIDLDNRKVIVSLNSEKFVKSLSHVLNYPFVFLPNVITYEEPLNTYDKERKRMDIGCFGALRLLKNQPFQAICAIEAADILKKKLYFHVSPNISVYSDPILINLSNLFKNSKHELVIHDWMPNNKFQKLVAKMDIGLQLSYTESFNIITADFINNNKLIVVSEAIDWLPERFRASTTNYESATTKIIEIYKRRNDFIYKEITRDHLFKYNKIAKQHWDEFLEYIYEHGHHHHEHDHDHNINN